ncbi:hypothetical protein N7501_012203 [Penicillium viridicatum]|nr:hypothetical protein N7501_012203 [Penicillium viridicatum]
MSDYDCDHAALVALVALKGSCFPIADDSKVQQMPLKWLSRVISPSVLSRRLEPRAIGTIHLAESPDDRTTWINPPDIAKACTE